MAFAEAGFEVTGIDVSAERVGMVDNGRAYLVDVPQERYADASDRLRAPTDYASVRHLDALTICVPTPLSKTRAPDLSYAVAAAESVAEHLGDEQLVVLQSTTSPGTTEDVIVKTLEERSGGKVGKDFFVGYAPERVDPGNRHFNLRNTPKLVAGITPECGRRTQLLYETVVEQVMPVSSTTVAETAKLHENTFRAVNIALANELARMCDRLGTSAWEVIDVAATKPFAFLPHYPGPGLGGDCMPVVPHFLSHRLKEYGFSTRLIDAAHEVNASMPLHVIQRIADALNDGGRSIKRSRLLLLGMAYKPNVHDTRESPSLEIMRQVLARGGDVRYCDRWVPLVELDAVRHYSVAWSPEEVARAECVVMLTAHRRFLDEPYWRDAHVVVDTRNVVDRVANLWSI